MSCSLLSNDSSLREAERTHLFNAMTTGISDSSLTNLYTMWNGMSEIRGIYPVVEKVEGTDATQFRPFLQDLSTRKPIAGSDRLGVFVDDLLRSVDVVYVSLIFSLVSKAHRHLMELFWFFFPWTLPL